jgi:hypothetical protein
MEANKIMVADSYKVSIAVRYPNRATVKKIGTGICIACAAAGSFVVIACYFKAMYGGDWKWPLIIASVVTAAGLGVLLFTTERPTSSAPLLSARS